MPNINEQNEGKMNHLMNKTKIYFTPTIHTLSKRVIGTLLTLVLAIPAIAQAADDFQGNLTGVSITDAQATNQPPVAQFTYTQDGDTFTFDASKSYDPDGYITDYTWDFGNSTTGTGPTITHQFQDNDIKNVSLTLTDNTNGITISQKTIATQQALNIAINFQPAGVDTPEGYLVDNGEPYSTTLGYGWTEPPNSLGARDRNNGLSPDQSYDTFIHLKPTAVWEYKLENGSYHLAITMGDPSYPDTIQASQAENQELIPQTSLSKTNPWIEKQTVVNVTDGALTITFEGSDVGKICWIRITNN